MKYEDKFLAVDCTEPGWTQAQSPKGPKGIHYQSLMSGGGGLPQVHCNRYEPHWEEARHRHVEDEVLVIVEGEVEVEGTVHRAPSVLFVGRHTLYGPLKAGPDGVKFYRIGYNEKLMDRGEAQQPG